SGAHLVQALQGKNRLRTGARGRHELGGVRRALEGEAPGARLPAGGLPRMPQHRLLGPHRPLRDPAPLPGGEALRQRQSGGREDQGPVVQGRHEAAQDQRRDEGRDGSDHARGSAQGRASARTGLNPERREMAASLRFAPVLLFSAPLTFLGIVLGGTWVWSGSIVIIAVLLLGDVLWRNDLSVPESPQTWPFDLFLFGQVPLSCVALFLLAWCAAPGDLGGLGVFLQGFTDWPLLQ